MKVNVSIGQKFKKLRYNNKGLKLKYTEEEQKIGTKIAVWLYRKCSSYPLWLNGIVGIQPFRSTPVI